MLLDARTIEPARPLMKRRSGRTMLRQRYLVKLFFLGALAVVPVSAQQPHDRLAGGAQDQASATQEQGLHDHAMEMDESPDPAPNPAADFLMERASGTSTNLPSAPMYMIHVPAGRWDLMFHGIAFINDVQQTGPRGADKFFSVNWFMGMAQHSLGKGEIGFRAMLSLDPATVTQRRFPELFQTGETAFGKPIVDGQHPHDFFMELSVHYARPIAEKTIVDLYFAPVGDPALGPVGFPHRTSASEIPQAPLGHHLQDSTHISDEVLTGGITYGMFRIEASCFHGGEPNENRWNIDYGGIDSWATRFSVTPTDNWTGQVSVGRLTRPEASETTDIVRSTASVSYNRPLARGEWASSVIWGRNHKTDSQRNINSYGVESLLQFQDKNFLTGRVELVDKDELFDDQPALKAQLAETVGTSFRIAAYTLGYTRDFKLVPRFETGLGANFTLYTIPSAIKPFYGDHPAAFCLFLRIRLHGAHPMDHMSHMGPMNM